MKELFELAMKGIHDFFRYGVGYILRWIFIFVAFVYLIFMTIALYEALNFQNYVGDLFTEKSTARRVLVELYNHKNATDPPPEKLYPVPVGAMAIRLDSLKNAVKELGGYQLNENKSTTAGKSTAGKNQQAAEEVTNFLVKAEFEQKLNELEPVLDNLLDLLDRKSVV